MSSFKEDPWQIIAEVKKVKAKKVIQVYVYENYL